VTAIGELLPSFELPDTAGARWRLPEEGAVVVFFTANRCPYALAWHDRIIAAACDYAPRGVPFLAICANDATASPHDSPAAMRQRYANERWGPVPYLHDAEQTVAAAYGAETTPDIFVLDTVRRLRYRGPPDEDCEDPSLNAAWLRAALDAVLAGDPVPAGPSFSVGCPIKWRGRPAHPAGIRPPHAITMDR
jgi:peroxiredoxin